MANWRGAWASGTAYSPGDSVSAGGVNYYCVTASTGQAPALSGNWIPQNIYTGPPAAGAPLASPAFTGTPTAPTEGASSDNTVLATTAYADTAVGVEMTRAASAEALLAPLAGKNTFTADQYFASGRPWFDVVSFGADPTGVADSTAAFQAAINTAIGLRTDTSVGFAASSTAVTDPAAVSGDAGKYITSPNFPAPGYAHITAVTPGAGYTVGLAATATLTGQTASVGTAAALTNRVATGPVYMPAGTFKVSSDLIIWSVQGFHFMGAGREQTILVATGSGGAGFTNAVFNINGSKYGLFENFTLKGDTTEQVNNALILQWNSTTSNASTSTNVFSNVFVRNLKFINGINLGFNATGTPQVDGTTFRDVLVNGGQTANSWSSSGNWQNGWILGNGVYGNNYDHDFFNCGGALLYQMLNCSASGFAWYGGQPGSNAIDFAITPGAQCSISGMQSQNSGQFIVGAGSGGVGVTISNVKWSTNYCISTGYWVHVQGGASGWSFDTVQAITNVLPIMYFNASGAATGELVLLQNIACSNSPSAGIVTVNSGAVVAINWCQYSALSGATPSATYPLWTKHSNFLYSQGTYASIPAASTNGEGFYWATDTSVLYHSNGTAWTSVTPTAGVVNAPDIQWFTSSGTWSKVLVNGAPPITTEVVMLAGGGGGGSGRRGASGTICCGGGGGGGGGAMYRKFVTSDLASTETVTVGSGGAGGAAVTTDSTSGNPGTVGTLSSFNVAVAGGAGQSGQGGTATSGTAGAGGAGYTTGGTGGVASTTGLVGGNASGAVGAGGGGAGGGICVQRTDTGCTTQFPTSATTVLDAAAAAGDLGRVITNANIPSGTTITAVQAGTGYTISQAATAAASAQSFVLPVCAFPGGTGGYSYGGQSANTGAAGVVDGTAPGSGTQPTIKGTPSCGGAGGPSSITTAAQAGATPYYGGGGGGGGASLNGNNSGAGGTGGPGFVLVISMYQ